MHSAADSAYRHVSPPLLTWKDGKKDIVSINGSEITIKDFGEGYRTTLSSSEELFARMTDSIDTDIAGINIIDRLVDDRPGVCFIDTTPELFERRHALINSFLSPELRNKWFISQQDQGEIIWNHQAMADFLKDGHLMQEQLLMLLFTGGGESPRGQEFLMTLIRNLKHHPRDIYSVFGTIRHFMKYSKVSIV